MNWKKRMKNRANASALNRIVREKVLSEHVCENCGEKGAHWVLIRGATLQGLMEGVDDSVGFWKCSSSRADPSKENETNSKPTHLPEIPESLRLALNGDLPERDKQPEAVGKETVSGELTGGGKVQLDRLPVLLPADFKCPKCQSSYFSSIFENGRVAGRYCKGWPSGFDRSYVPCPSKYEERYDTGT